MKNIITYFALVLSACAQTSEVRTVKAWTRTHVMGLSGGELRDPTGTIADAQRYAAAAAMVTSSSNLVEAAQTGLNNALERLYANTNRIDDFSNRIYIAADMDDDPGYSNVWSAVVGETEDSSGILHYFCHYSKNLSAPPETRWRFELASDLSYWADGTVSTNNITTNYNGYACYDISVIRPTAIGSAVLRANKFMLMGAEDYPLNISDAGISLTTSNGTFEAYTGSVAYTNAVGAVSNLITETYLSGTLYQITTNSIWE